MRLCFVVYFFHIRVEYLPKDKLTRRQNLPNGQVQWDIKKLSAAIGIGIFVRMNKGEFTTEAALLWDGIPVEIQKRILKSALCAKCNVLVEIVDYTGKVENVDLVLDGSCAFCGHAAAGVVEFPLANYENN